MIEHLPSLGVGLIIVAQRLPHKLGLPHLLAGAVLFPEMRARVESRYRIILR